MYETLERAGVMMVKEFLPVHFEIDLLEFPGEVVIWCYFRRLLISLAFRKCKKNLINLKLFRYKVFAH